MFILSTLKSLQTPHWNQLKYKRLSAFHPENPKLPRFTCVCLLAYLITGQSLHPWTSVALYQLIHLCCCVCLTVIHLRIQVAEFLPHFVGSLIVVWAEAASRGLANN